MIVLEGERVLITSARPSRFDGLYGYDAGREVVEPIVVVRMLVWVGNSRTDGLGDGDRVAVNRAPRKDARAQEAYPDPASVSDCQANVSSGRAVAVKSRSAVHSQLTCKGA